MVSGGQVRSDSGNLASYSSNYDSTVSGLSGSWQGSSYDSFHSKAEQFTSEFLSAIKGQMESFATACDLYEQYKTCKQNVSISQGNYNQAVSNNDTAAASKYSADVSRYQNELASLKSQIESNLASASGTKLEATAIATTNLATGETIAKAATNVGSVVQGAIDWAVAVAADNSHGYSQKTRWGNPNYDCSSLVISAYEAAGIQVKEAGAGYTGNMRSAFTKAGFEWIPGNPKMDDLQPGDVLLSENHHTEMYIGDGMNVGAHGDKDGRNGDSSGKEINVSKYVNFPWDGVLRYVGYDAQKA
ncbi:MAG: C40 family peptidase [Bacilli bacterium]|nr:C40 family peptidase [Bacilli bacterium]